MPGQVTQVERSPIREAAVELMPFGPEDVVSGSPEQSVSLLWESEDGTHSVGVWHCTPGSFYLDHDDETVVFIEGRATLTPESGEPVEIAAGDVGFVPGGQRVLWQVHETVRKGFHNHSVGDGPSGS